MELYQSAILAQEVAVEVCKSFQHICKVFLWR